MRPGSPSQSGTVDIKNSGSLAGTFSLSRTNLTNSDAANPLAGKINLVVTDCGTFVGATAPTCGDGDDSDKYTGTLAAMNSAVSLGSYAAGDKHRYRFTATLDSYKHNPAVRVVILTATGKGFCAGVDIKEMQKLPGNEGIIGANDSCWELFRAVYECAVPVIVAVNDFCLGTGIGICGNADLIVAAETATFGLPEVDNGALGAATHLMRLVPQHRARQMMYMADMATAGELHAHGSVYKVVPLDQVRAIAGANRGMTALGIIRAAEQFGLRGVDLAPIPPSLRCHTDQRC